MLLVELRQEMPRRAKNERLLWLDGLNGEVHRPVGAIRHTVANGEHLEVITDRLTAVLTDASLNLSSQ